jgi:hypothetical protein
MAARVRSPGPQAIIDLDGALRELRRDEPAIEVVETGLKAAKATGVPVELEGPKPPAAALAVTRTGFGPGLVPPKKPVPAPKRVPAKSRLGRVAAKAHRVGPKGRARATPSATAPAAHGVVAVPPTPAPLSADQLLQPPAPPTRSAPAADVAFATVVGGIKRVAKAKRSHPPAASKAKEAQDAAVPPAGDVAGQADASKLDAMDAQRPGSFDKKAFIAAVKAAIEAKSPKTLKEADDFKESGKAGEVKGAIKGLVKDGETGEAKDIETATAAPPDPSKAVVKPVTPMGPESPGDAAVVPAAGAVPKPASAEQLNLEAGKHETSQEMATGDVTEQQLAESNEPQFEQALADKKAAATHADTAPGEFRKHETDVIQQGQADATTTATEGMAGMHSSKAAALAKLVADKGKAKTKDEAKRAEVTAKVQSIFTATETEVKKILEGIDPKVEAEFDKGEVNARSVFESYVAAKMSAYKEDRYSGWLGGLRWAKDKLVGMPDKVNEFYEAGRELYLKKMDDVITKVADIVGSDLNAAKVRIAAGKKEIATYVKSLPNDLKKVGAEASQEIGERFSQLEGEVDAKQESVVDTLATKYVEARKGLDDRIEELQAENRGLVDKAIGAIKAVINTIRELVAMLTSVLARVASVVGDIVKHPVAFLGNLIDGIKGGILKFKDNIVDHLRKGLLGWLFGSLAEAGVELPGSFDLKGIIKLLASIFGLTWNFIRNRIVKQIGEKAMGAVESGVSIFRKLASEGIGGLWEMFLEKLGDIKEMILGQVKDFVVTRIITAGITWLISLLNPAAAFIKACKLIYDIVMFFVDNAARIGKFVNTILESVADIVRGRVGTVVDKIEDVLGQMVPIIIGFLASAIGLGGIGEKIRAILETIRKPVQKALDFVIKAGLRLAGPIIRRIKGISSRVKAKVAAGKAWVKGKVEAGTAKVKTLLAALPSPLRFRAGAEVHRVWIESKATPRVMVASAEEEGQAVLSHFSAQVDSIPESRDIDRREKGFMRSRIEISRDSLDRLLDAVARRGTGQIKDSDIAARQQKFARTLGPLFDAHHRRSMRLVNAVPKYSTPGLRKSIGSVRCAATLVVATDAKALPYPVEEGDSPVGTGATPYKKGPRSRAAYAMAPGMSTGQFGGYVLKADESKSAGERKIELVTRATGDSAPSEHAEARLLTQVEAFVARDKTWKNRVRSVEIHISHSPCPGCVERLRLLHKTVDNPDLRFALVQWSKRYEGQYSTTKESIDLLREKYRVYGP